MVSLDDLAMYGRFGWGFSRFLGRRLSLGVAREAIARRLEERETLFLRLVEKAVFGDRRSPYFQLMQNAGCSFADLRQLVRNRGLEGALRELRRADVYLRFEEFKGRKPIERAGQRIAVKPGAFDNRFLKHHYQTETGGSTGIGRRISHDLDHIAELAGPILLTKDAHRVRESRSALWRGPLPDGSGLNHMLFCIQGGNLPDRWYTAKPASADRPALRFRLATWLTVALARANGVAVPRPEPLGLDEAAVLARWAQKQSGPSGLIITTVSRALRVCQAAESLGIELAGMTFMVGGEPPTPAKAERIEAAGARYFPTYALSEVSQVAGGCAEPAGLNDLHLFRDFYAVIDYPREITAAGRAVSAFLCTTILPTTPTVMLNVELDDYGTIEYRVCGCPLGDLGYTVHLSDVLSYGKLTSESVTLMGAELISLVDAVLPAHFGGGPLDYQLVEEEDERGLTRITVVVSPRLAIADEQQIIETVYCALGQASPAARSARGLLAEAGSFRVKRAEPEWSARGKCTPLRLNKH